MKLAQKSGVFSEEHDHYLDLYTHAMMKTERSWLGQALCEGGGSERGEDSFFLIA